METGFYRVLKIGVEKAMSNIAASLTRITLGCSLSLLYLLPRSSSLVLDSIFYQLANNLF